MSVLKCNALHQFDQHVCAYVLLSPNQKLKELSQYSIYIGILLILT